MKHKGIALLTVKKVFPSATFARWVGECHCKQGEQIFWFHGSQSPDEKGWLSGGFYCPSCGFGNAGKCHIDSLLK